MSKIHILQGAGPGQYQAVVHAAVPAGTNAAGVVWSDAIKNSGMGTTVLVVGNGPGQISQSEANQIAAGTVIEAQFQWQEGTDIDVVASQSVAELLDRLARQLKRFGAVA